MKTPVLIYDITMELKDEYTALVNRQIGEQLQSTLIRKLCDVPEPGGVLLLDFSVVTSIHESFLDEFLIPVLKKLSEGVYGERFIIGIGIDESKVTLNGIEPLLKKDKALFLAYNKAGQQKLVGAADDQALSVALSFVRRTPSQTVSQLSVQMRTPLKRAEEILQSLARHRIIRMSHSDELGVTLYDAVLDEETEHGLVQRSLGQEIKERILETKAIEESVHFQLPSGLHTTQFLHLSRVLEDARFAVRIGTALGEAFKDLAIDVVLTAKTPNDLVLAQALGDYLECKVVSAVFNSFEARFTPVPENSLKPDAKVVVVVDVIASGWIVRKLHDLGASVGAHVEGVAAVVDISGGQASFSGLRTVTLCEYGLNLYSVKDCPLCNSGVPFLTASVVPKM